MNKNRGEALTSFMCVCSAICNLRSLSVCVCVCERVMVCWLVHQLKQSINIER